MCDDGVAQAWIRQLCQHGGLHHSHDLAGFGADHREAHNAVVGINEGLHEPLLFVSRLSAQDCAHRQPRNTHSDPSGLRFALAQSHTREWRVGEQAV